MPDTSPIYQPRKPHNSQYYQCDGDNFETLEQVYDERFAKKYGFFRSYVRQVIYRYLDCGILHNGFARVKCAECGHEYLLAFSCKRRHFCPSCHQKRVVEFGEWLYEEVLKADPHRHFIFSIPKILRSPSRRLYEPEAGISSEPVPYLIREQNAPFGTQPPALARRNRSLQTPNMICSEVFQGIYGRVIGLGQGCAWETLKEFFQEAVPEEDAVPGAVIASQTFGDFLGFNPHCHVLCTDGGFYGKGLSACTAQAGMFRVAPWFIPKDVEKLFRYKVFKMLLSRKKSRKI